MAEPGTYIIPSWSDFARTASQSYYPELWDGRVLDLVPALGKSGGKLLDISGFQNHGTLTNMDDDGDWVFDPVMGMGIDFISGSNDQVVCGSAAHVDDLPAFTLIQWIYPRTLVDGRMFFSKSTTGGNFGIFWRFSGSGGQYNMQIEFTGTDLQTTWGGTPSGTGIVANVWQMMAVTYDGGATASTALQAYKDGILVSHSSDTNGTSGRASDASYSLCLGNINGGTNQSADAIYGRTMLYNRVLSQWEIQTFCDSPYLDLVPLPTIIQGKAAAAPAGVARSIFESGIFSSPIFGRRVAA